MADIVKDVIAKAKKDAAHFKTTEVHKALELDIDIGNLLAIDNNPLDFPSFRKNEDEYVNSLTRDNVQLLINKIWELPSERIEDVIVVKLPDPTTNVPRSKKLPAAKTSTKWQEFAKTKGIKKRKKDKLVWDENSNQWHPRYGYRRAATNQDWVVEYKPNQDPYEDLFAKNKEEKSERVAKNELHRLRNIAKTQKTKVAGSLIPTETPSVNNLSTAAAVARSSTASLGKFTDNLPKEKPQKKQGVKRKFDPVIGDNRTEKQKSLDILEKIRTKEPKINLDQAANSVIHNEELMQAEKDIAGKGKKKGNRSHKSFSKKSGNSKKGKFGKSAKKNSQFKGKQISTKKGRKSK